MTLTESQWEKIFQRINALKLGRAFGDANESMECELILAGMIWTLSQTLSPELFASTVGELAGVDPDEAMDLIDRANAAVPTDTQDAGPVVDLDPAA